MVAHLLQRQTEPVTKLSTHMKDLRCLVVPTIAIFSINSRQQKSSLSRVLLEHDPQIVHPSIYTGHANLAQVAYKLLPLYYSEQFDAEITVLLKSLSLQRW